MTYVLAAAQAVFLMSIIKPLLFAAVIIAWGYGASQMSKDAGYYYLRQELWNGVYVAAIVIGIALMLYIPIFWGGWILAIIIAGLPFVGYTYYRNVSVPPGSKWDLSVARLTGRVDQYKHERAQARASLTLLKTDDEELPVPMGEDPNILAHNLLGDALDFALPRGGERIDITARPDQAVVSVLIDGAGYPQSQPEPAVAMRLIDYIKSAAGLDADRRKKQEGRLNVRTDTFGKHKLELETGGSTRGVKLSLWIDRAELANIDFDQLGLLDAQKKALQAVLADKGGVVLIASPPQQGRTTTVYSLLQKHDPYIQGVRTLEEDKPFDAEGVNHNEFAPTDAPQAIRSRLAALLRGDPDVMLFSRLPDHESAQLIARSADEIRFYIPITAEDTFAALKQWIRTVGSRKLAAESLGAIVAQRLVRKLCPTCRRPYAPDAAALKKLNLPSKVQQLYHASGKVMVKDKPQVCPTCMGLGYRGRTAAFEVMPVDAQARAYIASGEIEKLRGHLRKQKVLWLQEAGLAKVVAGMTDIKEVTRALGAGTGRSKKRAPTQPSDPSPGTAANPNEQSGTESGTKAGAPS